LTACQELAFFLKTPAASAARLTEELLARSDPASAYYAQWLSSDDAHAMAAPPRQARDAVAAFLRLERSSGAVVGKPEERTPNGDVVTVEVSVAVAEAMLGATYYTYSPSRAASLPGAAHVAQAAAQRVTRCSSYSLPTGVADAVAFVGPTTRFPTPLRPRMSWGVAAGGTGGVIAGGAAAGGTGGGLGDIYTNDPANLRAMYVLQCVISAPLRVGCRARAPRPAPPPSFGVPVLTACIP